MTVSSGLCFDVFICVLHKQPVAIGCKKAAPEERKLVVRNGVEM